MSARRSAAVLSLVALALAGCENEAASYQIGGSTEEAFTLIRERRIPWHAESEVTLVVARLPECQRRYRLNRTPAGQARAELYQTAPYAYLLRNGASWFAIDRRACLLQAIKPPPRGTVATPVGAFDRQAKRLRFVAAVPRSASR